MNKLILIFLFTSLAFSLEKAVDDKLKGAVKSVSILIHNTGLTTTNYYNHFGYLTSRVSSQPSLSVSYKLEYDTLERVVKEAKYNHNNTLIASITYRYDTKNNLIKETSSGELNYSIVYFYEGEKLVQEDEYDAGKYVHKKQYRYFNNRKTVKVKEETFTNNRISYITTQYDTLGNKVSYSWKDKGDETTNTTVFIYNNGYLSEQRSLTIEDTASTLWDKTLFNNEGNQIRFYMFDEYGDTTFTNSYNYKYDNWGNWINKKSYRNGILESTVSRKIQYY